MIVKWRWKFWYKNGPLDWKGQFLNGKKHGQFAIYHDDGVIYEKGYFKYNERIGFWITNYGSEKNPRYFYRFKKEFFL